MSASSQMPPTRTFAVAVIACAGLLLLSGLSAAPARAGTYPVYACGPAGTAGSGVNHSWGFEASAGANYGQVCPSAGVNPNDSTTWFQGMQAYVSQETGSVGGFNGGSLALYAPPGTSIYSAFLSYRMHRQDSPSWQTYLQTNSQALAVCPGGTSTLCDGYDTDLNPSGTPCCFTNISGATYLQMGVICASVSCPTGVPASGFPYYYASVHLRAATVYLQEYAGPSPSMTGGSFLGGGWLRGTQSLSFAASDGESGVRNTKLKVDGNVASSSDWGCDYTYTVPCSSQSGTYSYNTQNVSDGTHAISIEATDAAGNTAETSRAVQIDNTPPGTVDGLTVDGGESWRAANDFDVLWANPGGQYAPITRAHYRLCREGGGCSEGSQGAAGIDHLSGLSMSQSGDYTLRVWLEDQAGNATDANASGPVHLRFDPDAPAVSFKSQDSEDPLRVEAAALDATSGVAGGEIEMRRQGTTTWDALETKLNSGGLVAYVNDEELPDGTYELRARARDRAGNERSTDRRGDGAPATIKLPARAVSGLRAGFARKTKRRSPRERGGTEKLLTRARVPYKKRAKIRGKLHDPAGRRVAGAQIEVLSQPRMDGAQFRRLGVAKTDDKGRFAYSVRALQSQVVRVVYQGTAKIRSSTRELKLRVPAASTIKTSSSFVLNGDEVVFKGRLRGTPIPPEGKLVVGEAYYRSQWRAFQTARSDSHGAWRFPYRFGATQGRVIYRFRVRVPRESSYPFEEGTSRTTQVTVRGF